MNMSPKKQRVYLFDKEMSSNESHSGNYIDCHVADTYQAEIYVGFNPGYEVPEIDLTLNQTMIKLKTICQKFCDENSLAVSVESTSFIYKNGSESGAKIRFINYPRYPVSKSIILTRSLLLAEILKNEFSQYRVSVITTDKTYMLGNIE
jgi:hypothetical protein